MGRDHVVHTVQYAVSVHSCVPSSQHEILQRQCSVEVHQQAESVRGERDGE